MHNATNEQIAATFTEWERRYRENPEQFMNEIQRLLGTSPQSYGEMCAAYFVKLLGEIAA